MKRLAYAAFPLTAAAWVGIVVVTFIVNRSLDSDLVEIGSVD